jgi:hypothetical protein
MKYLMGFVVGVLVATAGLSLAQTWRQGNEPLDLSVGTRDWQLFWQQNELRDLETQQSLRSMDPCGR